MITDNEAIRAQQTIRKYCEECKHCTECVFVDSSQPLDYCGLHRINPLHWGYSWNMDMEKEHECSNNKNCLIARATEAANVTSPEYYQGKVEPIELMQAQMTPEAYMGFLRGNIIKYAARFGKKDSKRDEAHKIFEYAKYLVCAADAEEAKEK